MVSVGLTVILGVFSPVLHTYDVPPVAVSVVDDPEHTVSGNACTLTESARKIRFSVTTLSQPPPGLSLYQ